MKDFMRNRPEEAVLVVETGNAMKQSTSLDDPASRWVLEALNEVGCHAVNAAVADLLRLNRIAELGKLPQELRTNYIATMVELQGPKHFPTRPYVIQTLRPSQKNQEVRVGILAVSPAAQDWTSLGNSSTPEDALKRYLPEVDRQSDIVVLLARMPDPELFKLAQMFPAIDVIVNGNPTGEGREFPKTGDTVIVESAHGGIALGVLEVEWNSKGRIERSKNQMIPLPPLLPEDPQIALIAKKAHDASAEMQEAEARKSAPVSASSLLAGAKACVDCHEKAFKVWEKSSHAYAIETLKRTRDHFNDACLECHVTGFGDSQGYVNYLRTPRLANVQCEACHGPALQHSRSPQMYHPGVGELTQVRKKVSQKFCLRCHTPENSPKFNFAEYWKTIEH